MTGIFIRVLQMSLLASWGIGLVFALRFFVKRISHTYAYFLWGIVLFRLACPVVWEAPFGLLPSWERVWDALAPQETGEEKTTHSSALDTEGETADTGRGNLQKTGGSDKGKPEETDVPENLEKLPKSSATGNGEKGTAFNTADHLAKTAGKDAQDINDFAGVWKAASAVWALGVLSFWAAGALSYLRFRKNLGDAVPCPEIPEQGGRKPGTHVRSGAKPPQVWLSRIRTPFVMGILKPRIYLPVHLKKEEQAYILLHEQTHIRRGDHLVKLLGFLLLGIHWFNPLVYIALCFLERDMEMSCDEQVLERLGSQIKREYSASLLKLSQGRRISLSIPPAFGERDARARIRHVLDYRKPSLRAGGIALLAVFLTGAGLLFCPAAKRTNPALTIKQLWADTKGREYFSVDCSGETVEIPADQLGAWLEDSRFRRKHVTSPYELIYTYEIKGLGGEEQPVSLRLYAYEPELVMVYSREAWQYYTISQEDYQAFEEMIQAQISRDSYGQKGQAGTAFPQGEGEKDTGDVLFDLRPVGEILDGLFAELMEGSPASGNPGDYIEARPEIYAEILGYRYSTLAYCFGAFEQGGQTGLKGQLMAAACRGIAGGEDGKDKGDPAEENASHKSRPLYGNGQEWYDARKALAKELVAEQGWDEVVKYRLLEGSILQFLEGDMDGYTEEIFLPDYVYEGSDETERLVYDTLGQMAQQQDPGYNDGFAVWALRIHGSYQEGTKRKVIATVSEGRYHLYGERLKNQGESRVPMAFVYERQAEGTAGPASYRLVSCEKAGDGSYFLTSIQAFCTMPVSGEPIEGLADAIISMYGQDKKPDEMMREHVKQHLEKWGLRGEFP